MPGSSAIEVIESAGPGPQVVTYRVTGHRVSGFISVHMDSSEEYPRSAFIESGRVHGVSNPYCVDHLTVDGHVVEFSARVTRGVPLPFTDACFSGEYAGTGLDFMGSGDLTAEGREYTAAVINAVVAVWHESDRKQRYLLDDLAPDRMPDPATLLNDSERLWLPGRYSPPQVMRSLDRGQRINTFHFVDPLVRGAITIDRQPFDTPSDTIRVQSGQVANFAEGPRYYDLLSVDDIGIDFGFNINRKYPRLPNLVLTGTNRSSEPAPIPLSSHRHAQVVIESVLLLWCNTPGELPKAQHQVATPTPPHARRAESSPLSSKNRPEKRRR